MPLAIAAVIILVLAPLGGILKDWLWGRFWEKEEDRWERMGRAARRGWRREKEEEKERERGRARERDRAAAAAAVRERGPPRVSSTTLEDGTPADGLAGLGAGSGARRRSLARVTEEA